MTDFSEVPWKNIHVIDYGRRYIINGEVDIFYREPWMSYDFTEYMTIGYTRESSDGDIVFTEEDFRFDGSNLFGKDIHLELVEGTKIPFHEYLLWGSKCFVERIDGTGEPIKCDYVKHFCGTLSEEDYILLTQFTVDGHDVVGKFSTEGLPLCHDVSEYRLIYRGDVNDK